MKILQVISSFPPAHAYGGAPKVAYELSKELVKRGHEVTVYTTDAKDANSRLEITDNPVWMDGIEIYHFKNLSNRLSYRNYPLAPTMAFKLKKELHKFDIVHIHEYRSFHSIFVYHYCKKYGIPYILQAHGSVKRIIEKYHLKKLYDLIWGFKILKNAESFVAVSSNEINQYKEMGVTNKIFLVPNALNIDKFQKLPNKGAFRRKIGITNKLNIILFLGRIHKTKGIDFLIRTFADLVKEIEDTVLVIVGPDENHKKSLEKLSKNLNLSDLIIFEDYTDDVLEVYRDANVLVYPSIYEIFGLVPFEAIMCDTPIVITNSCGCSELIKEADCGYLVKYGDIRDLKSKIINVLDDQANANLMVCRGKEYIHKNLSWVKIAEKVEKIYENCIHNL